MKSHNEFTAREVAVLVEEFRSEFRAFGEGLQDLREKVDRIEGRLAYIEANFATKEDLRIFAKIFNDRLTTLEKE
ncbi:MAG: hypothetical protein COV74_00030 [Candidatus Omnitrophica bacterium CG11_big_fil_rev_8_21_14_0_20_45_26]|uniref:Uncharacterized protein n=1 Tax=Candidatus Abzuiibacterium crystallinum TaxID=1974748 RepID=A0A2H0LT56_9BACT|nr:MAG: hypothetical protein COV74_00030 [Candidatus Omnitrophica bacterium CG11_big_fil_rev_8_21_14_0_20_45_26]PIW65789.1 MAG: hypothetical protein COW12_00030 [Candidatus Omnitrophica bacterium CG12_big_fil_rev_8_21_14_0_65_45_16]